MELGWQGNLMKVSSSSIMAVVYRMLDSLRNDDLNDSDAAGIVSTLLDNS